MRLVNYPSTHQYSRKGQPIQLCVVHATAGTNSLGWLKQNPLGVSAHYLIAKDGTVYVMVPWDYAAGHAGYSCIDINGKRYDQYQKIGVNEISIGIEIENKNDGKDPYPQAQLDAAREIIALIRSAFPDILMRFHHEIDTNGKTDPVGLTWADLITDSGWYYPRLQVPVYEAPDITSPIAWGGLCILQPDTCYELQSTPFPGWLKFGPNGFVESKYVMYDDATIVYNEHLPILYPEPTATQAQCVARIMSRPHGEYTRFDVEQVMVPEYFAVCEPVGVNPIVAIAQSLYETDNWNAALAQRKDKDGRNLRNSAGIGVSESKNKATPYYREGTVFDADVGGYRPSCQFASWADSIRAHVGRLVAYATRPEDRNDAQRELVDFALSYRSLPLDVQGSAQTLKQLGQVHNPSGKGWAVPGERYGAGIAAIMEAISKL